MRDGVAKRPRHDAHALGVVCAACRCPDTKYAVVNAAAHELPSARRAGFSSRPVGDQGLLQESSANAALFEGDWLNTGDLGYFAGGELYITGRAKDVIVPPGGQHSSSGVRGCGSKLRGVRKGGVAVFPAMDSQYGH